MATPLQIVLNPEHYDETREGGGGGRARDFFAHRDQDFRAHKNAVISQLQTISAQLQTQSAGDVGYLKVILRREAWAKSHRPVGALFRNDRTPVVGGGDLGVLIVEARPAALGAVAAEVARAEEETVLKYEEARQKDTPNPSGRRSETGAIERLELYGPADRRDFSLEEAVAWLANPVTGSSYHVELFDVPPPRSEWDRLDAGRRQVYQSFLTGLAEAAPGLDVDRIPLRNGTQALVSMRLGDTLGQAVVRLAPPPKHERRRSLVAFSDDRERHSRLLAFLDKHPLVRRVELPGIVVRTEASPGRTRPIEAPVPMRDTRRAYPRIGVIDGGISDVLADWVIDRWDILAAEDTDTAHGTFIAGLTTMGAALNGAEVCAEADGTELIDLAVFPDQNKGSFGNYYDGLPQFFDEVETAVADARARHGVRIYNMSLNILQPAAPERYSVHASRLDQIAEDNNALFFISAGNTAPQSLRPEWPADTTSALATIAAARNDGMLTPAESVRNVAVAALNPPSVSGCVAHAPACFSRRGPGLRAGVKPDLAHIGGVGTPHPTLGHGLFSVLPDGTITDGCGTSYAAPIAAKTAAVLDQLIEGEVSRETLIALLVHHAQLPEPLQDKALAAVARQMVGFGMPPPANRILECGDNAITLVFASRLQRDQQINFRFSWPPTLVSEGGKCRGTAKLTLVSSPPLDPRFGAEFVRVNLDAKLQQENSRGWGGKLDPVYLPTRKDAHPLEADRIEHGLKWSPVKVFAKTFPRGTGASSNWRLSIDYLTRAGVTMPEEGVPFTAILTLSDPAGSAPVFNEMRQSLQASGTQISDIRTAARITPRV